MMKRSDSDVSVMNGRRGVFPDCLVTVSQPAGRGLIWELAVLKLSLKWTLLEQNDFLCEP